MLIFGGASEAAQGLQEFSGVDSGKMVITLNAAVLTFTVLYLAWLANRLRLQRLIDDAAELKTRVMTRLQQ